jgi:hypothetical protein
MYLEGELQFLHTIRSYRRVRFRMIAPKPTNFHVHYGHRDDSAENAKDPPGFNLGWVFCKYFKRSGYRFIDTSPRAIVSAFCFNT